MTQPTLLTSLSDPGLTLTDFGIRILTHGSWTCVAAVFFQSKICKFLHTRGLYIIIALEENGSARTRGQAFSILTLWDQ
ncbi:hypothetical protein HN51_066253, partial [Arachis hypogaea]